ncbi:glucosaminidase domain-containing protein [Candidatus Oscillochloris fontis]|uniref:glucosaminidase domain-containing protein n=1 Tax=Candidatus Oscillochloris fontis TaxID=2496868 RepID=UPI0013758687|nr:glucosaminidase domain-containing protein [Candidatus Oscillochloris fontis]
MPNFSPDTEHWWRERGEPRALATLLALALSLFPLVLLDLLNLHQAGRVALVLAWIASLLLMARLPGILRPEGRRTVVLAVVLLATLGVSLSLGFKTPAANAAEGLTFKSSPRISQDSFVAILQRAGSPAAADAANLYTIIVSYGLDPAVALAFFQHESSFCLAGACANNDLHNWGMLRRAIKAERSSGRVSGFARYYSWEDGVRDWCELILYRYVNRGLDTVEKAIPVYAPSSDNNVPSAYINTIRRVVASWSGRRFEPAPDLHSYTSSLDQALVSETFMSAGITYHPNWAFHTYMLEQARLGRPLGPPLDDSRVVTVSGQRYAVQVFAQDTLYTPLAEEEENTNWSDVRRLSDLLVNTTATPVATPEGE